jgi:ABC-type transport system involved in cytochrome c biogenesis permease subunit
MMVTLLFVSALLLYLAASGTLAASFAGGRETAPRPGTAMTAGAVILHGVGLAAFTARHAELPLVGLAPSLTTLAFLIALLFFATTIARESRPVGLVLVPLIATLLAIALVMGVSPDGPPLAFRGVWFTFHVLFAFAGYAGLAVSFAAGLLYLLQFRELKGKRLGRIFRFFPSLPTLDRLNRRGLAVGFPSLSLALIIAWAWTVRFQNTLHVSDPQVIWGVLTWITFAVLLIARGRGRANAERSAALASVIGFAFVVAAYIVLRVTMAAGSVFL